MLLKAMMQTLGVVLLALLIWSPLKPYGLTEIDLGYFSFNWIAGFIGFGAAYLVFDFANFKGHVKFRHYLIAALLCPFWLVARYALIKNGHWK